MNQELRRCKTCARPFTDRKLWRARGVSADVKYCSDRCRRHKPKSRDRLLEQSVISTLQATKEQTLSFKALTERLSHTAQEDQKRLLWATRRLVVSGFILFLHNGRPIDVDQARQPLTLSLK